MGCDGNCGSCGSKGSCEEIVKATPTKDSKIGTIVDV